MSTPMAETPKGRRARRRFDDDFKAQAVRLVLDEGKSVGAVARDLDLTETAELSPRTFWIVAREFSSS
jgi:transposase